MREDHLKNWSKKQGAGWRTRGSHFARPLLICLFKMPMAGCGIHPIRVAVISSTEPETSVANSSSADSFRARKRQAGWGDRQVIKPRATAKPGEAGDVIGQVDNMGQLVVIRLFGASDDSAWPLHGFPAISTFGKGPGAISVWSNPIT